MTNKNDKVEEGKVKTNDGVKDQSEFNAAGKKNEDAGENNTASTVGDRSREARRSEIVARLSAGGLPADERTTLEEELAELEQDIRDNPSQPGK